MKRGVKKEQTLQEAYVEEVAKSKVLGQLPFTAFAEGKGSSRTAVAEGVVGWHHQVIPGHFMPS